MRVITLLLFLCSLVMPAWAVSTDCPKPTTKALPKDTTIFFYQRFKNKKTFYIPILVLKEGKLSSVGKMLMPAEVTLYNLRDDKSVKIQFKNVYNTLEDTCQSIGEVEMSVAKQPGTLAELYASKSFSNVFSFNPAQADQARFLATVKNPCKPGQANYDKNGVMVCNADKLLAISHLLNQDQYWQLKQYRHDVGLRVNLWNEKDRKFQLIAEDCTECSD